MPTEPISLTEAKNHLRVSDDDPGIAELSTLITAARQAVEQYLNASIVVQARTLTIDRFPSTFSIDGQKILLPNGPVISVTSIAYTDTEGDPQTVASWLKSGDYITPVYGATWPSTRDQIGAVVITYQAGLMTTDSPSVLEEKDIWNACLLVLGDMWDNRHQTFVGVSATVNETLDRLLHFHRLRVGI